ncbi:cyclic nucleotide-binding-like protein [Pilobolus umbonatus]|nr:cyclic nucleotide-binding-like protein [Pilobolus umbonatus]
MIDIQHSSWFNTPSIPSELLQSLRQHSLFQRTNNECFLEHLACSMHLRTYSPRDVILVEGEPAKAMFFLLKGSVDVCSADYERVYATLTKGSCFGEIGILYSMPRTASVIARSKCIVATLTAEEVWTLLPQFPEVEKMLRFEAEERLAVLEKSKSAAGKTLTERNIEDTTSARQFLQKIPYFQSCSEDFLHQISLNIEPRHHAPNSLILKKGDNGTEIFFILSGTVEVTNMDTSNPSQPVARFGDGDYFGDIAVLLNTPCTADIRAITALDVYVLKKSNFIQVLYHFPDKQEQFKEMAENKLSRLKASIATKTVQVEPTPDENVTITPASVCSTTSDQDPTLLPPAHIRDTFPVRKRRDSVAVWSDPNLVALANKHMKKQEREETKAEGATEEIVEEAMEVVEPIKKEGRLMLLNETLLEKIVNYLDLMSVLQLSKVSHRTRHLIQHSENILHTLDFSPFNKQITDTVLSELVIGAHVRHLSLSQCYYITDKGLTQLLDKVGQQLETLDLNSCWLLTDFSLSYIGRTCPFLNGLDLSNCRKISDVGLFRLLDEKSTHNYTPLRHLSLSYCKKLSDVMMCHLNEFCSSSLESLNIQRCTRITDEGFSYWEEFPQLKELNLTDCSFLTDQTISRLVTAAPNLSRLILSFCCALSDVSIENVGLLSKLKELDASFCGAAVSDLSIHQLLHSPSMHLVSLNIRGCVRITDHGVQSIISSSNAIDTLNISQCPCISLNIKKMIQDSGSIHHLIA